MRIDGCEIMYRASASRGQTTGYKIFVYMHHGIDGNYPFSITTASGVITITPLGGKHFR